MDQVCDVPVYLSTWNKIVFSERLPAIYGTSITTYNSLGRVGDFGGGKGDVFSPHPSINTHHTHTYTHEHIGNAHFGWHVLIASTWYTQFTPKKFSSPICKRALSFHSGKTYKHGAFFASLFVRGRVYDCILCSYAGTGSGESCVWTVRVLRHYQIFNLNFAWFHSVFGWPGNTGRTLDEHVWYMEPNRPTSSYHHHHHSTPLQKYLPTSTPG